MRDYILFYVNRARFVIRGSDAFLSLSEFLRERLGLTGLKVVCGEGACGACTVLVGERDARSGTVTYRSANSCLLRLFQMDRRHIVTVEGLADSDGRLAPAQRALVEHHGTQCGYCTPGVALSLAAACETRCDGIPLTTAEATEALTGNLCRCTGYLPIRLSAINTPFEADQTIAARYSDVPIWDDFAWNAVGGIDVAPDFRHADSLAEALAFLSLRPKAVIVAGGTGAPQTNATGTPVLSVGGVNELATIERREGGLYIGAAVTWEQLRTETRMLFPVLSRLLDRFGSPQLRHQGTVGGSIAQGDYNADWLPLLLVQNATVHLASARTERNRPIVSERRIPYAAFQTEGRAPGELLTGVSIPLPAGEERLALYKVTRRQVFDRSVFCAAVCLRVDPERKRIDAARIACGGVGPWALRLTRTEAYLQIADYTEETMRAAGEIAAEEISPETDAYASAEYRRQLAAGLLLRFYHEANGAGGERQ